MANQGIESIRSSRLTSLDVFRGFTIVGMISGGLGSSLLLGLPILDTIARQFTHTDWNGLTFYDLVFPSFLFIVGIAMPFSFAKRIADGIPHNKLIIHAFKRAVVLFLLGALRVSVKENSPALFELSSALQPIAFAYFISFLFINKSIKFRGAISIIIILIYWIILKLIPVANIPMGSLEKNQNIVWYIDMLILGRSHENYWGTLLLFLPQVTQTLCGTIVGDVLRSSRSQLEKIKILGLSGVSGIILGAIMSIFIPMNMKLWSPSYVVSTIGWASIIFLILYWLIDVKGYHGKCSFFFTVFGMNAIALYLGSSLFGGRLGYIVKVFINDIANASGQLGAFFTFLMILLVKWLIFYWMYKRRIFIKV